MCGIVGMLGQRNVIPILLDGLHRLEYRGYDSAGVAVITENQQLYRVRRAGKVAQLQEALKRHPIIGHIGIAHTRWATHGVPSEKNAHPHIVGQKVAVVHNGIIENYKQLALRLQKAGYDLTSDTDTEIVAANIYEQMIYHQCDLLEAVKACVQDLEGAYALAVMDAMNKDRLVAARFGSPLVIGIGIGEYFLASDPLALQKVAREFIYLEDGDVADITSHGLQIFDLSGQKVNRAIHTPQLQRDASDKGHYRHYMIKEMHEQPEAIKATLSGRVNQGHVFTKAFGQKAEQVFKDTKQVQIVACGTSYHAGLVAKYWLETYTNLPCFAEIASEFRYRKRVTLPNTLFVTISQSGETADTLAALKDIQDNPGYIGSLSICNVPESSLVRLSDLVLLTHAGPEIGVATTKGFTTQLVGLKLLVMALGQYHGLAEDRISEIIKTLSGLPEYVSALLQLDKQIEQLAKTFSHKAHCLFLGRDVLYPIALEGALKLKEISYIHAEAYPGGELKHGPLALVDEDMPVVVVAANDGLLDKIKANIQEVKARDGRLIVFASKSCGFESDEKVQAIDLPELPTSLAPILLTIPLQLLSYYVAVLRGTDVDQPRNLAKSVTVE